MKTQPSFRMGRICLLASLAAGGLLGPGRAAAASAPAPLQPITLSLEGTWPDEVKIVLTGPPQTSLFLLVSKSLEYTLFHGRPLLTNALRIPVLLGPEGQAELTVPGGAGSSLFAEMVLVGYTPPPIGFSQGTRPWISAILHLRLDEGTVVAVDLPGA